MKSFGGHAAVYRITVIGQLDPDWSAILRDMTITTVSEPPARPITALAGSLTDQPALAGVLSTLHELGLTLQSVELVEQPNNSE